MIKLEGVGREIAWMRVLMDRDMHDAEHPPDTARFARALDSLVRAVKAQYGMSARSDDTLAGALAEVIQRVGGHMGLPEALR